MRNRPDYLIFDLDGTLVDSVADLTTALNLLADELGRPHLTKERVRSIVGDGATKLIKRAFGSENYQREQLFVKPYRILMECHRLAVFGVANTFVFARLKTQITQPAHGLQTHSRVALCQFQVKLVLCKRSPTIDFNVAHLR